MRLIDYFKKRNAKPLITYFPKNSVHKLGINKQEATNNRTKFNFFSLFFLVSKRIRNFANKYRR